jgi:hypothetical protein
MHRLTSVGGSFAAHVLEARLRSEGIDVQLRGAVNSPYQFTLGSMSLVDVYVPDHDLDDARLVMLVDEVEAVFDDDGDAEPRHPHPPGAVVYWLALAIVIMAGAAPILRLILLG